MTVTQPTAPGYITVYPTGTQAPTASNLNFVAGQDIANLVTAKIGANGQVDIYNFDGDTQVLFDAIVPGGVGRAVLAERTGLRADVEALERDVDAYVTALFAHPSTLSRWTGAGVVSRETAEAFGAVGPAHRAAGAP